MGNTDMTVLSVVATTANKLSDLPIKNGQLIFVQDKPKIALDFGNTRKFYNQIELIQTESERLKIENPINGLFYFEIESAILWFYQDGWTPLTTTSKDCIFTEFPFPESGQEKVLYVNKGARDISLWDSDLQKYTVVADKTESISKEKILALFNTK